MQRLCDLLTEMVIVRVWSESDVGENSVRRFVVEGREILLGKFAGKYYAPDEKCTHRGGPLSEGVFDGGVIKCLWHFRQFDLKSGEVRGSPPRRTVENI